MTTKTHISPFESYVLRTMPAELRSEMPPEGWYDDPEEWAEVRRAALRFHRTEAAYRFAIEIGNGWRASELATGELSGGASVAVATGRVVRPPTSTVGAEWRQAAMEALREVQALGITLDPVIASDLDSISLGWLGDPHRVDIILSSVRSEIALRRAALTAETQAANARPIIKVPQAFEGKGRRLWQAGTYPVTPDDLLELEDWRSKMEADAAGRGWERPEGFQQRPWPPFEVTIPTPPEGR